MSKEYEKFKAEYDKKIKPKLKSHGKSEAGKLTERIRISFSNAWEGENVLKEGLVPAHEAGITGTKLADYMKNKDFKDSYDAYKTSVEMFAKVLIEAETYEKEALAVTALATKLDADITKDLKKRKDRSKSKTDIEALQKDVKAAITQFADAAKMHSKQNKMRKEYPVRFTKNVQDILKTPPDQARLQKDSTELPQLFVDRVLKGNTNKAALFYKTIKAKTDEALELAETDLGAASGPVREAAVELKAFSNIAKEYAKAMKDRNVKSALDQSKDKAKVLKTVKAMQDAFADAERRVRGVATTLKKAAA